MPRKRKSALRKLGGKISRAGLVVKRLAQRSLGFLRKKIKAPKVGPIPAGKPQNVIGHRGTGSGRKWQVGASEVEDYLYGEEPVYVNSSNVYSVQYFDEKEEMIVEYLDGSRYVYFDISLQEATSFMQSGSKGSWVWSNLRVRGSATGAKKAYRKL